MEPYEKIYVAKAFLDSDHGQIACVDCHGGNPQDPNWQTAHRGLIKDPTFPDPEGACGECHPDISAAAPASLHYTIAPIGNAIARRMGPADQKVQAAMETARERHCSQCHASCGQCHVSRPNYVSGGFLAQHQFRKTPPMETWLSSPVTMLLESFAMKEFCIVSVTVELAILTPPNTEVLRSPLMLF